MSSMVVVVGCIECIWGVQCIEVLHIKRTSFGDDLPKNSQYLLTH